MPRVDRIRLYPVKALDGIDVEAADVLAGGTLAGDREYALFDADGEVINGKRTTQVHELDTDYDPDTGELAVETADGDRQRFCLPDEREQAGRWFGEFFGLDATLRRDPSLGFVDRREMGPSVVSRATLETVAGWFDELTLDGVRRRLRTNVEVEGVPAFWEDRFVGEGAPTFTAGDVRFEGVEPCGRCVVPERDPDTGESLSAFRERFVEKRRETLPDWVDESAFDHWYTVTLIARTPEESRGRTLRVGDEVAVVE